MLVLEFVEVFPGKTSNGGWGDCICWGFIFEQVPQGWHILRVLTHRSVLQTDTVSGAFFIYKGVFIFCVYKNKIFI